MGLFDNILSSDEAEKRGLNNVKNAEAVKSQKLLAGSQKELTDILEEKVFTSKNTDPVDTVTGGTTPESSTEYGTNQQGSGGVKPDRVRFTQLTPEHVASLTRNSHVIGSTVKTIINETLQSGIKVQPKFESRCTDCGIEYEEKRDECEVCESKIHIREPDKVERHDWLKRMEKVNSENQSLEELIRVVEKDVNYHDNAFIVVRKNYIFQDGEITGFDVEEINRGHPLLMHYVVDENGKLGNYWWICPDHRNSPQREPGQCMDCGKDLEEVTHVKTRQPGSMDPDVYYVRGEVLGFNRHYGDKIDGLTPIVKIWKQATAQLLMDAYAVRYFNPTKDQVPDKLLFITTSNSDSAHEAIEAAKQQKAEDPYATPMIIVQEDGRHDEGEASIEVIDLMDDTIKGQQMDLRKEFKQQVAQEYGVKPVIQGEQDQTSGVEGTKSNDVMQIVVSDRLVDRIHQQWNNSLFRRLGKMLGMEDYQYVFDQPVRMYTDQEEVNLLNQRLQAAEKAVRLGLEVSWTENNEVRISDGKVEKPEGPGGGGDEGGGMGEMFGNSMGQDEEEGGL